MRLVTKTVASLDLARAKLVLENLDKRAARPILLTLKQASANAVNNFGLKETDLKIKEIQVNKGPTLKRWRAVSRGRARTILKRTSHLRVVLEGEGKEGIKAEAKKTKQSKKNNQSQAKTGLVARIRNRKGKSGISKDKK